MFICFIFSAKAFLLYVQKTHPTRYEFENESDMNRGVSLINAWPWNEVRLAIAKKKEKRTVLSSAGSSTVVPNSKIPPKIKFENS